MSKHSVTIRGLRVVTTCWSWARSNRTSPSKWVGLGSPLAACSVYGDLTCSVHTVNNLCMFNCQCHFYLCNRGPYVRLAFVPNMLSSWNKDIIIISVLLDIQYILHSHGARDPHRWGPQKGSRTRILSVGPNNSAVYVPAFQDTQNYLESPNIFYSN